MPNRRMHNHKHIINYECLSGVGQQPWQKLHFKKVFVCGVCLGESELHILIFATYLEILLNIRWVAAQVYNKAEITKSEL